MEREVFMIKHGSGRDFERKIFDHASSGVPPNLTKGNFSQDVSVLIDGAKVQYPETRIGHSLHGMVKKELERLGVNPSALVFLDALDTNVDWYHFSDGVFHLNGLVVTIDAYSVDTQVLRGLRESWFKNFTGEFYSNLSFQTDLFLYKSGLAEWQKSASQADRNGFALSIPQDFRTLASRGRPENHFVLAPYYTEHRQHRKVFAKMVAAYFAKAMRDKDQKTALQSH